MAKLNELKNPITSQSVNILNPADTIKAIGYVAWVGMVVAIGMKALIKADEFLPGNVTPNHYKTETAVATTTNGVTVL